MKAAFIERAGVLYERPTTLVTLQGVTFYQFVPQVLIDLTLLDYVIFVVHNGKPDVGPTLNWQLSRQIELKIRRLFHGNCFFASCFEPEPSKDRLPATGMIDKLLSQFGDAVDVADSIFFASSVEGIEAAENVGFGRIMLMRTGLKGWHKPEGSKVERYDNMEKAIKQLKKEQDE